MNNDQRRDLLKDIEELRRLVGTCSTTTIVGVCASHTLNRANSIELVRDLTSPAKQWLFLLGLMLTSPEPDQPRAFGPNELSRATELLNNVFNAYALAYFPDSEEEITEKWRRAREVAMPAFFDHFNQTVLATCEQLEQRITEYVSPFDDALGRDLGIRATDAVAICRWLTAKLQAELDDVTAAGRLEEQGRRELLRRADDENWTLERLKAETQEASYRPVAEKMLSGLDRLFKVSLTSLIEEFGVERAKAFWSLFSAARGSLAGLSYPTEANLAETISLFRVSDDMAMCPSVNGLYNSVLVQFEKCLATGADKEQYFRHRDQTLETEVERLMRRLFGARARYYTGVFETPDQHFEHDLVIVSDSVVFVVESKASAPVEPFRDPDRAFTRIQRAFRSSSGIQHAFDQGNRIWTKWASDDVTALYDRQGQVVCRLDREAAHEMFVICATRDNFGTLAVDLSLLLEREETTPYPWAVNVLDFEAIVDAWEYFGWNHNRFLDFLRQRCRLHGRTICSDELDIMGFFMQHGNLSWISDSQAERVHVSPNYSTVFDRIYHAQLGGEPVELKPTSPCVADVGASIRTGQLVSTGPSTTGRGIRQGRNELCMCGSGKKHKYCCGR